MSFSAKSDPYNDIVLLSSYIFHTNIYSIISRKCGLPIFSITNNMTSNSKLKQFLKQQKDILYSLVHGKPTLVGAKICLSRKMGTHMIVQVITLVFFAHMGMPASSFEVLSDAKKGRLQKGNEEFSMLGCPLNPIRTEGGPFTLE